jgi:glyoxylase-like metal-dependent hydrolase (beta-lactamase superfamily II)
MHVTHPSILCSTLRLFVQLATKDVPTPVHSAPPYYRLKLGSFEVMALSDAAAIPICLPPERPRTMISAPLLQRPGSDPAKVDASIDAFLINTGVRLVLVDAGAGATFDAEGRVVHSLRAAGYRPEDVTDVVIAPSDADRPAGLTVVCQVVFANAIVHVFQPRSDPRPDPDDMRVRYVEADAEIVPGIRAVAAPGSTPARTFFRVESEGRLLVLWGDLVQGMDAPLQPDHVLRYGVDEDVAAKQRRAAVADAAAKGYLVGAAHISFPGIGHVAADGSSYLWLPVTYEKAGAGRPR